METKKKPERMCIVCRNKLPKERIVKIVNTADELRFDKDCKLNGRGVYICKNEKCINEAIKRQALNRALKMKCPDEIYKELENFNEFDEI